MSDQTDTYAARFCEALFVISRQPKAMEQTMRRVLKSELEVWLNENGRNLGVLVVSELGLENID